MVVSDTSPLNYLILIQRINLLPQLYTLVLIPRSVLEELNAPETPDLVRTWGVGLPDWLEVSRDVAAPDPDLSQLHAGEMEKTKALKIEVLKVIDITSVLVVLSRLIHQKNSKRKIYELGECEI